MTLPLSAERYLDDLARLLADVDQSERLDVVTSTRDRITRQLGRGVPLDQILAELGSPEAVARAVLPAAAVSAPAIDDSHLPLLARPWVAWLAAFFLAMTLFWTLVTGVQGVAGISSIVENQQTNTAPYLNAPDLVPFASLSAPLWLAGVVLLWISPLWPVQWKLAGSVVTWLPVVLGFPGFLAAHSGLALLGVVGGTVIAAAVIFWLLRIAGQSLDAMHEEYPQPAHAA